MGTRASGTVGSCRMGESMTQGTPPRRVEKRHADNPFRRRLSFCVQCGAGWRLEGHN